MIISRWCFLTVFLFYNCYLAACAEGTKSIEEWNPPSVGPVVTWTAPLTGVGKLAVQPFFFYNRTRGYFDDDGHYHGFAPGEKKYQYQQVLLLKYGVIDRLEFAGEAIFQESYIKLGDEKGHTNGFSDSYLYLRYCVTEEKDWLPYTVAHFQLKMPTGKYQHADPDRLGTDLMGAISGGGSWDPGFGINLTKKLKPLIFHADVICSFPQEVKVDGVKTIYGTYLNYDFGVEYFLPKGFNLMFEVNGFAQGDLKANGDRIPASDNGYFIISPGIGWSCKKLQTLLAYQRVLVGTNVDANDSIVFTCMMTF